MFSIGSLSFAVIGFLAILFAVGFWGDRFHSNSRQRPIIYSLALGIHCTSWAFYGTTAQSATYGWAFTPTYIGSIVVFLFGYPILQKIIRACQQHNISSLADFISYQYDKSYFIAAFVTLICFIGVLPYTALQLDAVTTSVNLLTHNDADLPGGVSLYVAILMAMFAIIFGTRSLILTEKHPGLMLAIAFESIVKLVTFLVVGIFVCYFMFDGVLDLLGQSQNYHATREILHQSSAPWVYLSHMLLGLCSMFCLPRQFHINYVENNGEQELRTARWMFPLYLLAINLFVLPVALGGKILLNESSPDSYVMALPILSNNPYVALAAFIGGLAAASSMVIVATLAIGTMMANNLITPLWLKIRFRAHKQQMLTQEVLLNTRRLTVILVVGLSYLYYVYLSQTAPLANSGIIAMALLAQLVPSLLLGLYWKRRRLLAATVSLLAGGLCWCLYLLWPSIKSTYYFSDSPSDLELSQGVFISLAVNICCYIFTCLLPLKRLPSRGVAAQQSPHHSAIKISSLLAVTQKIFSPLQQQELQNKIRPEDLNGYASEQLLKQIETELIAHVGGASAQILLATITEKHQVPLEQLVGLVEEASQRYQFNHELLQSSVEHITQGISVIDRDLKLLAWNQRYIELFNYPVGLVYAGTPIESLLRFNAQRGLLGKSNDIDCEIEKRLSFLQLGSSYQYLRHQADGKIIELQGNPIPGGGFVTTYSDITDHLRSQKQLQEAKDHLEHRVATRTAQLEQANQALQVAKQEAERANDSKTKFLAAAGHDLMQPFNAATLYGSMIEQQSHENNIQDMASNLLQSLNNAEELLGMLLDMTKLESGGLNYNIQQFRLDDVLRPLVKEFELQAQQKGLKLNASYSNLCIESDKKLLYRLLQNLLSNAIRYTHKGKIVIGARRTNSTVVVQVLDTGIGIAAHQQREIFNEFHQLNKENHQGLGLGLTIVERICNLLSYKIRIRSSVGHGTCFSIQIPRCAPLLMAVTQSHAQQKEKTDFLSTKDVLIIDNEPQILNAMQQLFSQWGAKVYTAIDYEQAYKIMPTAPSLLLVDYHLNHNEIGVEVAQRLHAQWRLVVPTIINSADYSDSIRDEANDAGLVFLSKPVKSGALKQLIKRIL